MDSTDKYASVEGHSNLVRDESSQAIINTDLKGYELFKKRKETLQKQKNEINEVLHKGKRLVLFPEGTSSDGNRVLKFKSSLFSVVENKTDKSENYLMQAVTICYKGINGLPMSRSERPLISWWGDMDLMNHLWNILKLNSVDILVIAHEPIQEVSDRKSLSKIAWEQVAQGMGLALAGNVSALNNKTPKC